MINQLKQFDAPLEPGDDEAAVTRLNDIADAVRCGSIETQEHLDHALQPLKDLSLIGTFGPAFHELNTPLLRLRAETERHMLDLTGVL